MGDWRARRAAQALSLCVASHHSGLIDCVAPDGTPAFLNRMGKDCAATHLEECLAALPAAIRNGLSYDACGAALEEIVDVMETMRRHAAPDGIPRDPAGREAVGRDLAVGAELRHGMLIRFLLGCLVDADHTDSADFDDPDARQGLSRRPAWDVLCGRLEGHLAGLAQDRPIDGIRTGVSASCLAHAADAPGLFSLTVPTGGGKTLAVLRFALHHARTHGLDRVIYVVPYTSIIEQNAEIVRGILEPEEERGGILLEHHSSLLPEKETRRGRLLAQNWDAPVILTTMTQFLETLFGSGTRRVRRMRCLARSVIVFDEAQAVPIRLFRLFCMANDFLMRVCGASVVLCTAIQPALDALPHPLRAGWPQPPRPRELAPDVPGLFRDLRRVRFEDRCDAPMSLAETADLAVRRLGEAGSCLVVGNTGSWVRNLFGICRERLAGASDARVVCLTTNLCPAHRSAILGDLRKRLADGERVLCCSTQLIECGVDISFGAVIRAAAGLESILQSAERCNRHGERPEGVAHVILPMQEEESLRNLPDVAHAREIFLALRHALQRNGGTFDDPDAVRRQFANLLNDGRRRNLLECPVTVDGRLDRSMEDLLSVNEHAGGAFRGDPRDLSRQAFAAAARNFHVIPGRTRAVLVPWTGTKEGGFDGLSLMAELSSNGRFGAMRDLLRRAQRFSVGLPDGEIRALNEQGALESLADDAVLALKDARFYDEELGVLTEPKGGMDTLLE